MLPHQHHHIITASIKALHTEVLELRTEITTIRQAIERLPTERLQIVVVSRAPECVEDLSNSEEEETEEDGAIQGSWN